ncbi:MAG TPA: hypothetical protein VK699_10750 [Terriglobales bacterium]|nr:hypothetical protein [Terriglobales bacterium]
MATATWITNPGVVLHSGQIPEFCWARRRLEYLVPGFVALPDATASPLKPVHFTE